MTILAIALLIGLGLVGLAMIPLGLPGLWVMVGGILAYGWLTGFRTVSVVMIAIILAIAFLGEIIEERNRQDDRDHDHADRAEPRQPPVGEDSSDHDPE